MTRDAASTEQGTEAWAKPAPSPPLLVADKEERGGPQLDPLLSEMWAGVQALLRTEFGEKIYQSWLHPIHFAGYDDGELVFRLPNRFICDWVKANYGERIRAMWTLKLNAAPPALRFETGRAPLAAAPVILPAIAAQPATLYPIDPNASAPGSFPPPMEVVVGKLDERYSLEKFVMGPPNEFAYSAARRFADPRPLGFNPLFLHGATGLGKTHLMHGIGWEMLNHTPATRVGYMTAEQFFISFVSALRKEDTLTFKQRLRSLDVLLLDDLQFIAGKNSTQDEFFHTLNALIDDGRRVVISADRSPGELDGIEDRIRSRLGGGMVADVHATDYELRLNILLSKLENGLYDRPVPNEVLDYLARRITTNVRELEGALTRVTAHAAITGAAISIDYVKHVLADVLRASDKKISIDDIQRKVADHYKLKLADLLSNRRSRDIARPRQMAMYLAKRLTPRSLPEIGRRFGNRDHTTVMHAIKRIDELRAVDSELEADLERLLRLLEG